jgi:hypothetical protein
MIHRQGSKARRLHKPLISFRQEAKSNAPAYTFIETHRPDRHTLSRISPLFDVCRFVFHSCLIPHPGCCIFLQADNALLQRKVEYITIATFRALQMWAPDTLAPFKYSKYFAFSSHNDDIPDRLALRWQKIDYSSAFPFRSASCVGSWVERYLGHLEQ